MDKDSILYDENDAVVDEELLQDSDDENTSDEYSSSEDIDDSENTEEETEEKSSEESGDDDEYEYKVSSITSNFLRLECGIKHESAKTMIKFSYRGSVYKGIVMQKFPTGEDNYIFLVQFADKSACQGKPNHKVMKKIYIPDASLIK